MTGKTPFFFISFLLLLMQMVIANAAENHNVMLHLKKNLQHDTLGVNIVQHILPLVYTQIMGGNAKLWDSPDKNVQLSAETLQRIEKNTQTSFPFSNDVFILEKWHIKNKKLYINTQGFYFINKSIKGEEVSYGYVDAADLKSILTVSLIPANANGYKSVTFWHALLQRNFEYTLVQYGNMKIQNIAQSDMIKKVFYEKKYIITDPAYLPAVPEKLINYSIPLSYDTTQCNLELIDNSNAFLKIIENYLKQNLEEYFNLGGYRLTNYLEKEPTFIVTKLEINEIWKKGNSSTIENIPQSFIIWINEVLPLDMTNATAFYKWGLSINYINLEDFIKSKNFLYIVQEINNQEISSEESNKYIKALNNYNWNQLSEYVKYF